MAKLLLVEDDKDLTAMVCQWLSTEHQVEVLHNGREARERLALCDYDLIVLDWELPELAGIDILRAFRAQKGTTPVIMLTGKRSLSEKEEGLDVGADDYLTKPFHVKELAARIRAILRRFSDSPSNVLEVGSLRLDPTKHTVFRGAEEVRLLPREFMLLEFLMRHPGTVFSAESLLQRVWASESDASVDAIRTCIKRLRQKLDSGDSSSLIETIAKVGYRLKDR